MQDGRVEQPFDEDGALRDLEQLRRQIADVRSRREQTVAEFEEFVRTNRAISQAERAAVLAAAEAELAAASLQRAAQSADRAKRLEPAPTRAPEATPARSAKQPEMVHLRPAKHPEAIAPAPEPAPLPIKPISIDPEYGLDTRRDPFGDARLPFRAGRTTYLIAGGIALAGVLAFVLWPSGPEAPTSGAVPTSTAVPQGASNTPAAPRAVQIQLTTIRAVWMRVIVDGQKQFEREAPGGQTLTFGGDESIALRAGDGGALRLSVGGTDRGIMGRDGQVVNRVFSK